MKDFVKSEHVGHMIHVFQGKITCLTCKIDEDVQPCGCLPPRVYCIDHQPEEE